MESFFSPETVYIRLDIITYFFLTMEFFLCHEKSSNGCSLEDHLFTNASLPFGYISNLLEQVDLLSHPDLKIFCSLPIIDTEEAIHWFTSFVLFWFLKSF